MDKTMEKIHSGLLRKFHTLCSRLSLTADEKRAIVSSYGVDSSADIDTHDLINICGALSQKLNGRQGDAMDKLRKRVIGAIGGWLRSEGLPESIAIIKGIACRASKHKDFNKIPAERLRNLYNLFLHKQRDKSEVDNIARDVVAEYYGKMNTHNTSRLTN